MSNVVRAEFGRPAEPVAKGDKVADNKRTGFVLMYRSLLTVPFKNMPERFALWVHLMLEASYDSDEVAFNRNVLQRKRGQVVTSVAKLAHECGVSEDSARRSLEAFERDGMISRTTRRGSMGYTVIELSNYDDYQRGITRVFDQTNFAELDANLKPAPELGLEGYSNELNAELSADLGAELHAEDLNNKTNKQTIDPDNTVGIEFAEAPSSPPDEPEITIPEEAAIHGKSGKSLLWGTVDDLTCANWFRDTRAKAFKYRGLTAPKHTPQEHTRWSNEIRLMRERDSRSHLEICELFAFVCSHQRELEFCQSPAKLRSQWDTLQLKRANAKQAKTQRPGALSNLAAAQAAAQAIKQSGAAGYDDDTVL